MDYKEITASVKVATYMDFIVITSGSLFTMVCSNLSGAIIFDAVLEKFMLAPESSISRLMVKL